MKSELAEMQAELRYEAQKGRTLASRHLTALVAARMAAAAKRRSGRCAICAAEIDPDRASLCAWCRSVERARREVQIMWHDLDFARKGYQILGPWGGRRWTRNGDPGGSGWRRS